MTDKTILELIGMLNDVREIAGALTGVDIRVRDDDIDMIMLQKDDFDPEQPAPTPAGWWAAVTAPSIVDKI
jgi:hypothetical protein